MTVQVRSRALSASIVDGSTPETTARPQSTAPVSSTIFREPLEFTAGAVLPATTTEMSPFATSAPGENCLRLSSQQVTSTGSHVFGLSPGIDLTL